MIEHDVIQTIHRRLVEAAKKDKNDVGAFVYYIEIIQMAGIMHYGEGLSGALGKVLYDVNEYDRVQDPKRPILSAVAISAEREPSEGFYVLARDYGKYNGKSDKIAFWLDELKSLREYWQKQSEDTFKTHLLTWNPQKYVWQEIQEIWDALYMGHQPHLRWSCGNTKNIDIGDRVFLIRLGHQETIKGIVASGFVTEKPFDAHHWNDEADTRIARYIRFEPDVLLRPEIDELLDPNFASQDFDWFPQRSGIMIPSNIAAQLEKHWQRHVGHIAGTETAPILIPQIYREGAQISVSGYQYERNIRAREACVQHYGTACAVCGFDFDEEFGDIGDGYIHVHHLIPISERHTEYIINPIEDLRPVCPNCHAMLHKRNPPYSIAELRHIRKQVKSLNNRKPD